MRPDEGLGRFGAPVTSRVKQRIAIRYLQLLAPGQSARRLPAPRFVRHRDRSAQMGDRLLEGRAAKGRIACLAPPFDREIVETGFSEMMGNRFWLGGGALRLLDQDFRRAAVQGLAAALEQALVGCVLDQRVLEPVIRLRTGALNEQDVGLH